jgi:hypothetical protein
MRRLFQLLSALLCILPMAGPAAAQDEGTAALETPFLILRLETELGYTLTDRQAGMSGAVYTLAPPPGTPLARLQIAYDVRNAPVLARLVAPMPDDATAESWQGAAAALTQRLRQVGDGTGEDFSAALGTVLAALKPGAAPVPLPSPAGPPATLRALEAEGIAVLDVPITVSPAERLRGSALRETVADATLEIHADGDRPALSRYHAPDGRFGGGRPRGESAETGSWRIAGDGTYCIERAPVRGFRCALIFRLADGTLRLVPLIDGRPDGRGLRRVVRAFGNPGGFTVPRRADATGAPVTRMILPGRTEERRGADGLSGRLYLAENGRFSGQLDGTALQGVWTVLEDGRRCLIPAEGVAECAFLSETDGGTYRLFDADNRLLGEVQYLRGDRTAP